MIQHPTGPVRWLTGRQVASILDSAPHAASPIPSANTAKVIPPSTPTVRPDIVMIPPRRNQRAARLISDIASQKQGLDQINLSVFDIGDCWGPQSPKSTRLTFEVDVV
jgi:hypothetical protein